ncbi:MAG TPA: hypothetical protein VJA94_01415 [Candidatus Angelobacter sp.]
MDVVTTLHEAYQEGRRQTKSDPVENALRSWLEEQSSYLRSRLAPRELAIFVRCKSECTKAEKSVVLHGDVQSACRFLATAQIVSERSDLSHEARLRCRTELAAAESHVDDCCHDFEHAKEKALESMALDEELEDRFGYRLTHVHRIHLLNRLVTLEARSGRLPEAMRFAATIFRYLEGTCQTIPLPGSWGHLHLMHLSPGILKFLTRQLAGEIAGVLLREENNVVLEALKMILQGRSVSATPDAWDPVALAWFDLKILTLQADKTLSYLKACTEFLAKGPGSATLLWHLTALDAAMICKSLRPHQGGIFARAVLTDLLTMDNFPLSLRIQWVKFLNSKKEVS